MTAVQHIESLLPTITPNEKARIFRKMAGLSADTFPGIEKTPGVCGGSACIIRTRIPVWSLVAFKKLGLPDDDFLENWPSLRRQDLVNAWNYYLANPGEIEREIRENDEA